MNAKTKKYIEYGVIGAGLLLLLWLLTRSSLINPKQASNLPSGNPGSVGGNTYNGGNITIPGLNIPGLPAINVNNSGPAAPCSCNSCGCDTNSPSNQFAASIAGALDNYQTQISKEELAYNQALFGTLPTWITQYLVTADPNGRSYGGP